MTPEKWPIAAYELSNMIESLPGSYQRQADMKAALREAIRQAEAAALEIAVMAVRRHCPSCKGTGTYPAGECEHCTPQIRAIRARKDPAA